MCRQPMPLASAQCGKDTVHHHPGLAKVVGRIARSSASAAPIEMLVRSRGARPAGQAMTAPCFTAWRRMCPRGRARIHGRCRPEPIITASLVTRPCVRSMLRRIASASTSSPWAMELRGGFGIVWHCFCHRSSFCSGPPGPLPPGGWRRDHAGRGGRSRRPARARQQEEAKNREAPEVVSWHSTCHPRLTNRAGSWPRSGRETRPGYPWWW